ncbi:MAG: hypothetical protein M1814_006223 [Vezdaea aestivalis]|nr:MAG: hypothetical protein M1814_006223 [Vezdaea aestivalis]
MMVPVTCQSTHPSLIGNHESCLPHLILTTQAPEDASEMRALDCSAAKATDNLVQSKSKRRKPPTLEAGPVRKSRRLIEKRKQNEINLRSKTSLPIDTATSLLSPPPSYELAKSRKRKRQFLYNLSEEASQAIKVPFSQNTDDSVAWWAEHQVWPPWFKQEPAQMSKDQSKKRKSSSTHHSERVAQLEQHGVFMTDPIRPPTEENKILCNNLRKGDLKPNEFPSYHLDDVDQILERIQNLNEARLQRDITPWVVPSAENLNFRGDLEIDYIGEEVQAEWIRCATMGSTKPRPDYVAGLQRKAFTKTEIEKLQNYTTIERPFLFTPNLSFPFLICEAKTGLVGMDNAHRQNIHSGSIAVAAIITLYQNAFRKDSDEVKGLFSKILVFTISHDHTTAKLFGHYAIASNSYARGFACYRSEIALHSLTLDEGKDRYKMYNFTINLYREFAPEHLKRIRDAIAELPEPDPRTNRSLGTSQTSGSQMPPPPIAESLASQFQRLLEDQKEIAMAMEATLKQQLEDAKEAAEDAKKAVKDAKEAAKEAAEDAKKAAKDAKEDAKNERDKVEAEHKEERKKDREEAQKQMDLLVKQLEQQNNFLVEQLKQQREEAKQQREDFMNLLRQNA